MTTTMTTNFGFFAFTVNNFLGEHSLILDNIYSLSSLIYNIEKYILLSSVSLLPLPFIFLSGSGKKYLGQGIKYGSGILASYGATKQSLPPQGQGCVANSGNSSGGNPSGGNSSGVTNNSGQGDNSGSNSNIPYGGGVVMDLKIQVENSKILIKSL